MWNFGNSSIPAFPQAATESKDSSVFIARPATAQLAPNGRLAPLQCSAGRANASNGGIFRFRSLSLAGGSRPWGPQIENVRKSVTFAG